MGKRRIRDEGGATAKGSTSRKHLRRKSAGNGNVIEIDRSGARLLNAAAEKWNKKQLATGFVTWKRATTTSSVVAAGASLSSSSSSSSSSSLLALTPPVSPGKYRMDLRNRLLASKEHQTSKAKTSEELYFVYIHVRLMYLGEIEMRTQSFGARFDLHVMWDPKNLPPDAPTGFSPIVRFPEAMTWAEVGRVDIAGDFGREMEVSGIDRCLALGGIVFSLLLFLAFSHFRSPGFPRHDRRALPVSHGSPNVSV